MAKVPVLRTSSKIDPAELAVAQERTEARLTDLFRRRTAAGRRAGPRPPIIVDGVELIGSPDEPPLTSSPAVADDRPPAALPGAPSEPPLGDLVDVIDRERVVADIAQEVADQGVRVVLVEPSEFRTDISSKGAFVADRGSSGVYGDAWQEQDDWTEWMRGDAAPDANVCVEVFAEAWVCDVLVQDSVTSGQP